MSHELVTEEFLDTYEGEVMFLSQDLEELEKSLQSGVFTRESLDLLTNNMIDVHDVFLSSQYTQHIAPIFKDFSEFIASMSVERLLEHKNSISYLCAIILDINTYIEQYFIGRVFSNVYLFQDSLKNSIEFLKTSYKCEEGACEEEDDGSEILFL
ncbi:hypothetical protein JHD49_08905 [Sulfurimonas sp. SAG-AH-194-C21]|nr:hypothetical protein [Sulfurimonas sp. SAG-AH-194-C21]MDF1884056.1 hypothetical protein [Sulfurimonas sp. SAG-AH-194-C21]